MVVTTIVAALCVVRAITFPLFDTDFWQHLAVGRGIWQLRAVPQIQIWCWTTYGEPYVLPSWGFRALLWPVWKLGGLNGLYAWRWLTTLAALGVLWAAARRMGARGMSALPVLVIAALIYRQRSQVRPESLGAILLAAELWLLETHRTGGPLRRFWIVAIAWVWANVHLSYVIGLGVLGLYALEATWRDRSRARGLWILLAACAAVSFLNPSGVGAFAQVFEYFFVWRHEPVFQGIGELRPIEWGYNARNGLFLFLAGWPLLQVWRARRGRFDPIEAALCLLVTPAVLTSQRWIGFWALVAGLFIARDLDEWIRAREWPRWSARPRSRAALAAAACVIFTGIELTNPDFGRGTGLVVEGTYPRYACDFIERQGIAGRSFNQFKSGGYLDWRFWPDRERLPFATIHSNDLPRLDRLDYVRATMDRSGWGALDARHHFDWVLLMLNVGPDDRLLDFVDADTTFALVFLDDANALYVRRTGRLAALADSAAYHLVPGGAARLDSLWARVARDHAVRLRLEFELKRMNAGSPLHGWASAVLSSLMLAEGRLREAREALEGAHAANPGMSDYHERLGLIAFTEGRLDQALEEYQRQHRLGETASLDVQIGSVYRRMGNRTLAQQWFRRALSRDPGNQAARDSLAALEGPPA